MSTVISLVVEEDMSGEKGSGSAVSIESEPEKLEPEVKTMLVGLVVATGVVGALVLLS